MVKPMNWYYRTPQGTEGPVPLEFLKSRLEQGKLAASTMVWMSGFEHEAVSLSDALKTHETALYTLYDLFQSVKKKRQEPFDYEVQPEADSNPRYWFKVLRPTLPYSLLLLLAIPAWNYLFSSPEQASEPTTGDKPSQENLSPSSMPRVAGSAVKPSSLDSTPRSPASIAPLAVPAARPITTPIMTPRAMPVRSEPIRIEFPVRAISPSESNERDRIREKDYRSDPRDQDLDNERHDLDTKPIHQRDIRALEQQYSGVHPALSQADENDPYEAERTPASEAQPNGRRPMARKRAKTIEQDENNFDPRDLDLNDNVQIIDLRR